MDRLTRTARTRQLAAKVDRANAAGSDATRTRREREQAREQARTDHRKWSNTKR